MLDSLLIGSQGLGQGELAIFKLIDELLEPGQRLLERGLF
jgi:hypothetical protein